MLTRPDLADDAIIGCLQDCYGLAVSTVSFLPINVDPDCAVFRLVAIDGKAYFLKLRRRNFNPVAAEIPTFLHAQGIQGVMAPLATAGGALWARSQGFTWLLYPFFEGKTALRAGLSRAQWIALGRCMSAIHRAVLPAELAGRIPREDFAPRWRSLVRTLHRQATETAYSDPTATTLAGWWMTRRDEIMTILERAERLAGVLSRSAPDVVLCHADLHGNNVLVGAGENLAVVDWDEPILAPKERDLMFVGGGVGGVWNRPESVRSLSSISQAWSSV